MLPVRHCAIFGHTCDVFFTFEYIYSNRFDTFGASIFNQLLTTFVLCLAKDHWRGSILLIKSDLKWCVHLSRNLFLYWQGVTGEGSMPKTCTGSLFLFISESKGCLSSVHQRCIHLPCVCNYNAEILWFVEEWQEPSVEQVMHSGLFSFEIKHFSHKIWSVSLSRMRTIVVCCTTKEVTCDWKHLN